MSERLLLPTEEPDSGSPSPGGVLPARKVQKTEDSYERLHNKKTLGERGMVKGYRDHWSVRMGKDKIELVLSGAKQRSHDIFSNLVDGPSFRQPSAIRFGQTPRR
ncbi:hypothetical protein AAES_163304 [Amazona aestiva]|uniref:Uncharacterized protein n=1 Tax=Amazona aestiva TaxID=12930 RepID=A0A0Q3LU61_AMAAE|nr:hypothetical protein AAES_163304 [Amazona aestiva]